MWSYRFYQAQWHHILQSQVLAMDEVPIKAGRKGQGKMQPTYYWPLYGEEDEVAFTWSTSRGHRHAVEQLKGFSGTLLADGYSAYEKAVTALNEQEVSVTHAACWAHGRRALEKALHQRAADGTESFSPMCRWIPTIWNVLCGLFSWGERMTCFVGPNWVLSNWDSSRASW